MSVTCSMRNLKNEDLPMILSWRNHQSIRRYMFTQHEITLDEHKKWFLKVSADFSQKLFIVEEYGIPLGYVQFKNVFDGGVADWGFYVSPDSPKGSGRKIGITALTYAFKNLKLHKVCGRAIDSNELSIAFHQRLGFKEEGLLRDQQIIDGRYHSLVCFGLLSSEWVSNNLIKVSINAEN